MAATNYRLIYGAVMIARRSNQVSTYVTSAVGVYDANSLMKSIPHGFDGRNEVSVIRNHHIFVPVTIDTIQRQLDSHQDICLLFLPPLHLNHLWGLPWGILSVTICQRVLWEQYGMGVEKRIIVNINRRQSAKCPQVNLLTLRCPWVVHKTYHMGREITNAVDRMGRQQHSTHCVQVEPLVRCALDTSVVQIEPINVDVGAQPVASQIWRDHPSRWPHPPSPRSDWGGIYLIVYATYKVMSSIFSIIGIPNANYTRSSVPSQCLHGNQRKVAVSSNLNRQPVLVLFKNHILQETNVRGDKPVGVG